MLQIHFGLLQVLWEPRIIKMSKVGTITMKLQGRDRKGNRRLMANSAKPSPCSQTWRKGIKRGQQRRKGASAARSVLANHRESGLCEVLKWERLI